MIGCEGEILILTGPPGSGKTTAAQTLAALPGAPKVHLHADDFWHVIGHGAIAPYRPEADGQNGVVMRALAAAAQTYAEGGYFVIVDGIVGPWFLAPFRVLAAPIHYVLLHPPLAAAIARCRQRGGDTLTDPATIAMLHDQLTAPGPLDRHRLSIDGCGPAETVDRVAAAIEGGAFRLSPA